MTFACLSFASTLVAVSVVVPASSPISSPLNLLGRLMMRSLFDKDIVTVQVCIMVVAIAVALGNLAVDISYGWFDPRIRRED
jgi:hypothetical protein